jgi:hypothetical protein
MSPDTPELTVYFEDTNTDRFWPGATCAGGAEAGPVPAAGYPDPPCQDGPAAVVPLSPGWQRQSLPFSGVASSPGGGYYAPSSLDPQGLLFMGFQVENPSRGLPGPPLSFQVCVAQIYFTQ